MEWLTLCNFSANFQHRAILSLFSLLNIRNKSPLVTHFPFQCTWKQEAICWMIWYGCCIIMIQLTALLGDLKLEVHGLNIFFWMVLFRSCKFTAIVLFKFKYWNNWYYWCCKIAGHIKWPSSCPHAHCKVVMQAFHQTLTWFTRGHEKTFYPPVCLEFLAGVIFKEFRWMLVCNFPKYSICY